MPGPTGGRDHIIEPLGRHHDRAAFSSAAYPVFETYIRRRAGQDAKRRIAAPFVLCEKGNPAVLGFYTLSACAVHLPDLPADRVKKDRLPPGRVIPATLLGQLAVSDACRGKGLGEFLLLDALDRAHRHSQQIASYAVVVDALDETAAGFYRHFDLLPMPAIPRRLYLPMATVARLF